MTRFALVALMTALAVACAEPPPTNSLRASGHVEVTETRLAPDAGGRILTFAATEGDRVETGQVLLTLDQRDTELTLERARAERAQAAASLRLVRAGARAEDIRQADAQLAAAEADLAAARAQLAAAQQDLDRFEALLTTNSGPRKQRDDAATKKTSRATVSASASRARAAADAAARLRAGSRAEDRRRQRPACRRRRQIAILEKALADATFASPVSGVITEKLAEPGEVIAPRTPSPSSSTWPRRGPMSSSPSRPCRSQARAGGAGLPDAGGGPPGGSLVSPRAEFTPRNVQTADERSRLVYRVRIAVDNRDGILKQGMPVEAELALAPVE